MKAKLVALGVVFMLSKDLRAQLSVNAITYINAYKNLAIAEEQRSGIPAAITLAQGIHESESGTSELVQKSNNHFGIKCKEGWTGGTVFHDDDSRGECFRSYATPADSYRDHSDFLAGSPRYAFLFKLDPTDFEGWAYGLRKAGYATNIKYSQLLIKLIRDYNLQQYTLIAMGKMKPAEEVVLTAPGMSPGQSVSLAATQGGSGVAQNGAGAQYGASGEAQSGAQNVRKDQENLYQVPSYPQGEFVINRTRVIFAKAGTSLLSIADQYDISLSRLLDFNDMQQEDVLVRDQLLFLQRKRKTGSIEFHVVRPGETIYDICQTEGVRYKEVLEMNQLNRDAQPAVGEKVWLQSSAPSRPRLASAAVYKNPSL